ncbi:hypothetical protein G6F57_009555 [Rhizopus arrhizus]|nr:hypothetical protein G6F24_009002 [Rhizopus arrhizus]KAG0795559.1 hypothetical protein G6F22_005091 [Rhizopus arrhizus]KAG0818651.1 hypothetical protein G6F20_001397 [Rhizopus arrhizus]KAG0841164.1 hypothetical protein G6F19_001678 [Rhizopus arrhizus]KAG0844340.1 hypothetical protein G6F18_001979 [Rhizopus arrhizus]
MDSMYPEQQNRQQDLFINIQRPHHPYYNQHDDLIFNHRPVSPISPPLTLKEEAGHLEKRPIRSRGRRVSSIPGPGTRMFTCNADGCGKVFKRSEHLKRHIRSIHTLEKPFECPYQNCHKRFSRSDNLNQHIRIHRHNKDNNKKTAAPGILTPKLSVKYAVNAKPCLNYSTEIKKLNLLGLTLPELQQELSTVRNVKPYTALQLWQHIYKQGHVDFTQMTNLSKDLQAELSEKYTIYYGDIKLDKIAKDQTRKFLIGFNRDPRAIVETVIIPEPKRSTLCVSSQIGCSLNCSFCHTGTQKLERSLTAAEVVGQYMTAAKQSNDFPIREKRVISNMVFMGQGEPLYNWRQISKAVKILTDEQGLNWSKPKITISTSGVVPLIPKIATELGVSLAISLHATNNDLRNVLVPLNKMFSLEMVLDACKLYAQSMGNRGKRITFEYVMLKNVNDSLSEARTMAKLLKQLPAHVNLIPFNPWPGSEYESTHIDQIERFANIVSLNGIHCTIRRPRGQDQQANSTAPTFGFGSQAANPQGAFGSQNNTTFGFSTSQSPSQPSTAFGTQQQPTNAFGASTQQNTGFGSNTSVGFGGTSGFGTSSNATGGFGNAQNNATTAGTFGSNIQNTTGFGGFGSNSASSQPGSATIGFGAATSQPATSTTLSSFGSTSQPVSNSNTFNCFGNTSQPVTNTNTLFGSTSQPATSSTSTFGGFGTSQPATSNTSTFGGFGNTSQPASSTTTFGGFGTTKPTTNIAPFGATATTSNQTTNAVQGSLLDLKNCFPETSGPQFIIRPDGITRSTVTPNIFMSEPEVAECSSNHNLSAVPSTVSLPKPKELPRFLTSGLLSPGNGKRRTIDELVTKKNDREKNEQEGQNVPQYKPEPKTPKGILAEKNTDPYQGFYRNLRKDVTSV